MIRYKKLGLIQHRKLLFTLVSFYYHRNFGRMLLSDKSNIFYSLFEGAALLEGLLRRHGGPGWERAARQRVPPGSFRWRRFRRRRQRLPLCLLSPQPRQVTSAPPREAGPRADSASAIACVAEAKPGVQPEAGGGGEKCAVRRRAARAQVHGPEGARAWGAGGPRCPRPTGTRGCDARAPVTQGCPAWLAALSERTSVPSALNDSTW